MGRHALRGWNKTVKHICYGKGKEDRTLRYHREKRKARPDRR
jgi:hypothetical protein